ncbi:MAG: hypothetical protein WA400_07420, partial [Silvibacterium sp.]
MFGTSILLAGLFLAATACPPNTAGLGVCCSANCSNDNQAPGTKQAAAKASYLVEVIDLTRHQIPSGPAGSLAAAVVEHGHVVVDELEGVAVAGDDEDV